MGSHDMGIRLFCTIGGRWYRRVDTSGAERMLTKASFKTITLYRGKAYQQHERTLRPGHERDRPAYNFFPQRLAVAVRFKFVISLQNNFSSRLYLS